MISLSLPRFLLTLRFIQPYARGFFVCLETLSWEMKNMLEKKYRQYFTVDELSNFFECTKIKKEVAFDIFQFCVKNSKPVPLFGLRTSLNIGGFFFTFFLGLR